MNNLQLESVHKVQLEIANEVKRICDKYNIKYFMIAGTLLGAVRHKGFIPWDDDLDIGMLRNDYNRFIKLAAKDLKEIYYLETWYTSSGYGLPYAKIRKNKTKYIEKNAKDVKCHPGIFIDIFPFDNVPYNKALRLMQEYWLKFYQHLILEQCIYQISFEFKGIKGLIYTMLKKKVKGLGVKELKEKYEAISKRYNKKQTEYVVAVGGSYGYKKEVIRFTWISQIEELEFEGHLFKAPKGYKDYLTNLYGDYMTPPSIDKRSNRHCIIELKL